MVSTTVTRPIALQAQGEPRCRRGGQGAEVSRGERLSTGRDRDGQQERQIVRDLRRRHPRALEQVSKRYGPLLRGYLGETLGDRATVEDVLQMTLIDVWRRGPTYDPSRASLTTWLSMIARSRAIDHHRRRVPEPFDPDTLPELVDHESEDMADALVERWRVAGLIAGLPKQEAQLLEMRFYMGLSQSEISERTGIPLGTVKMRMVRALEATAIGDRQGGRRLMRPERSGAGVSEGAERPGGGGR